MFAKPFDFSLQRTRRQAIGWYTVYFGIWFVVGMIVAVAVLGPQPDAESVTADALRNVVMAGTVYTAVVGALLVWNRDKNAANVALVLLGILASALLTPLLGLALLAVLTTRPSHAQG